MCEAFKIPSPRKLLAELDSRELSLWIARQNLEPFASRKIDIHAARILHAIYQSQGGTRYTPEDFIHKWYRAELAEHDVEKKIRMFFGLL